MNGFLHREGDPVDSERLGAKGALLCEAMALGMRVPPFFVLTSELFGRLRKTGELPPDFDRVLDEGLAMLERATGRRLGHPSAPLVVSVRASSAIAMPGALETVLDVGAIPAVLEGLARQLGDPIAALDVRRRALESWATAVLRVPRTHFDEWAGVRSAARPTSGPRPRSESDLVTKIGRLERLVADAGGIPDDPRAQVRAAIGAVLRSWEGERAVEARRSLGIDDAIGPAVIVQGMVFGNAAAPSGAGVAYTRHPLTGEKVLFGEWLPGAQGDEIMGGRASPSALCAAAAGRRAAESLERQCPEAYAELERIASALEAHHRDVLELELTLERGTLWLLQLRIAKCAPRAAVRIATDLVREGRIDRTAALGRIDPALLDALVIGAVSQDVAEPPLTRGLPASPGAAWGRVVFDSEEAIAARGEPVILVRPECSPEDAPGIRAAAGVLTASGGLTSHAAVIARTLGKPCVVAAGELRIDLVRRCAEVRRAGGLVQALPPTITLDGGTGRIFAGRVPILTQFAASEAAELLSWARELGGPGPWKEALTRYPV